MVEEYEDFLQEHSEPGWDGYDAKPIRKGVLVELIKLHNSFNHHCKNDLDLTPYPDGSLELTCSMPNGDYHFEVRALR